MNKVEFEMALANIAEKRNRLEHLLVGKMMQMDCKQDILDAIYYAILEAEIEEEDIKEQIEHEQLFLEEAMEFLSRKELARTRHANKAKDDIHKANRKAKRSVCVAPDGYTFTFNNKGGISCVPIKQREHRNYEYMKEYRNGNFDTLTLDDILERKAVTYRLPISDLDRSSVREIRIKIGTHGWDIVLADKNDSVIDVLEVDPEPIWDVIAFLCKGYLVLVNDITIE